MQSVSPRTAGFNTLDLNSLRVPTMIFVIMLMFIGASPASTGGGIKTTTFFLLLLNIWQVVRGKEECEIFGRRITGETMFQAFAIASMSLLWVFFATLMLTCLEDTSFLYAAFEVVSAYARWGCPPGSAAYLHGQQDHPDAVHVCRPGGFMTFALALAANKLRPYPLSQGKYHHRLGAFGIP
mgnify:CR=1 FL=1